MKILVVGSKGFVGIHTLNYFRQQYPDTWGCDVVTDYIDKRYHLVDATNADYASLFQQHLFDVCINCSGAASVPDSLTNPYRDYTLNTFNVFKLLDSIRRFCPSCLFINLSSAAVYGNPQQLPIKEDQPLRPPSPYGHHKQHAEDICQEFTRYHGMRTCCLRIFSAYGVGLRKQLFWDLSRKALESNSISLFGTGKESRDFIYITDLVQVISLIAHHPKTLPQILNVANGEEVFIRDAVVTFLASMRWRGDISFSQASRKGDPLNWVADISILQKIGYKRSVSFEEGLNLYALWIQKEQ